MAADAFVELLAVSAERRRQQQYRLRRQSWQMLFQVPRRGLGENLQAGGHIVREAKYRVCRQVGLRHGDALVGRVVEAAFQPLGGCGDRGVQRQHDHVARQRADALRSHRVPLVRHRARADLRFAERLLQLAEALQQPHVVGELGERRCDPRQSREQRCIDFSRVRLRRNGVRFDEAHSLGNEAVQPVDFARVAVEELQERGFGPGGAPGAAESQSAEPKIDLLQVE